MPNADARRPVARCLAVALTLFLPARGESQEAEPAGPVVDILIAASPADAAALAVALAEPLERQGVRLRWMRVDSFELSEVVTPDPAAPPAAARAWVDLAGTLRPFDGPSGGGRATVCLVNGTWDRVLVREVPLAGELDEVAREEVAAVLAAGVEGFLAGADIGRARDEVRADLGLPAFAAPPPLPAPLGPPGSAVSSTTFELELGLGYELQGFSAEAALAHGPALYLVMGARQGSVRLGAWVSGQYRFPIEVAGTEVGVRLDEAAVRVVGVVEYPLDGRLAVQAGLGAGVDAVRIEPRRTGEAEVTLEPVGWTAAGVAQLMLGGRIALGGGAALWLGFGLDVDLARQVYVVERDAARETVLAPWPVRPFGFLRVTLGLLGGGPE